MSDDLTTTERAALDELTFAMRGPHTLEEVARRVGLSVERVRALEKQALRKMRRAAARRGLTFFTP